jgi:hypothetical protein
MKFHFHLEDIKIYQKVIFWKIQKGILNSNFRLDFNNIFAENIGA